MFDQLYDLLELQGRFMTNRRFHTFMTRVGLDDGVHKGLDVTALGFRESLRARLTDDACQTLVRSLDNSDMASATDMAMAAQKELALTAESVANERTVHQETDAAFNELIVAQMRELGQQFNAIHDAELVGSLRSTIVTLTDSADVRIQLEQAAITTINKIREKDRIAATFAYYCGLYDRACARAERKHLALHDVDQNTLLARLVKAGSSQDQLLAVLDRWPDDGKATLIRELFAEEPEADLDVHLVRLVREYMSAAEKSLPVARLCLDDQ